MQKLYFVLSNFSAETFKALYFYLFSEDSLVQRTSKIENSLVHWPKPLVWGKWTPSFSHPGNYNVYAGGIHVVMQFMKFLLFCYTGLYTDCKIFAEKC